MGKKITDEEIEKSINKIIQYCKENNNIIPNDVYVLKNIIRPSIIAKNFKKKGFDSWANYFREMGYHREGDFKLKSDKFVESKYLTLNMLYELFDIFKISNNCIAKNKDYNLKNNLPSWVTMSKIINDGGITLHQFFKNVGRADSPKASRKDFKRYLEIYKNECNNIKRTMFSFEVDMHELLPSASWFPKHCGDVNVKTYNDFVIWCGLRPFANIPKDLAIELILKMQSKLDRPLNATDFNNPKDDEIGIRTIYKIWGEVNIMQKELGLEVTDKHAKGKQLNETKADLIRVCDAIYEKENRKTITYKDIKSFDFTSYPSTYAREFKEEGTSLREFLKSIGFELQSAGNGLNYTYNDGEKIVSQYELTFSNYLRDVLGLKYNESYIRDVKYRTFANYKGLMNCDYVINYKNRKIYIEVAGMLSKLNSDWRETKIKSKTKDEYRNKLLQKEEMFKDNNIDYYIILPYQLDEEFFMEIFK